MEKTNLCATLRPLRLKRKHKSLSTQRNGEEEQIVCIIPGVVKIFILHLVISANISKFVCPNNQESRLLYFFVKYIPARTTKRDN